MGNTTANKSLEADKTIDILFSIIEAQNNTHNPGLTDNIPKPSIINNIPKPSIIDNIPKPSIIDNIPKVVNNTPNLTSDKGLFIYILELQSTKYYVGKTINPDFRLDDHFNGKGSKCNAIGRLRTLLERLASFRDNLTVAVSRSAEVPKIFTSVLANTLGQ